ncbi:hypothetical protein C8R43DRAFT_1186407 [Mycena crocata]|nr:hypothetical protein C8R43DRAFT_1186407 [Mycena crocata]
MLTLRGMRCPIQSTAAKLRFFVEQLQPDSESLNDQSPDWHRGFSPLQVSVVKAHAPFTLAVVLEVEAADLPPDTSLPNRFILNSMIGALETDSIITPRPRCGVLNLSHFPGPHEPVEAREMEEWTGELDTWRCKYQHHLNEVLAYRYLRSLQVRLLINPSFQYLHPAVNFVNGIAISVTNGTPMHDLHIGENITKEQAETVSQRVLDLVRMIQAHRCLHNDRRFPNIILSDWPAKIEPILVDFGAASVTPSTEPVTVYPGCGADEVREIRYLLADLEYGVWHFSSPFSQRVAEEDTTYMGFFHVNDRIEKVPEPTRSNQYERIAGTYTPDAKSKMLQWRVMPGVKTRETW